MSSLIIGDRVVETSTTTGTGDFTLAGAVTGYQRFSAKMSVGDTCYYTIEGIGSNGLATGEWETGVGTYSAANTLTRTSVKDSSNSGSAVSFSAGTKRVYISPIAKQLLSGLVELDARLLGSSAASISFTGIPATFIDLLLVLTGAGDTAATFTELRMRFNNDTASNYDFQFGSFNNASYTGTAQVALGYISMGWIPASTGIANAATSTEIIIPNYANTTFLKDAHSRSALRTGTTASTVFRTDNWGDWRSTAAINRVDLFPQAGNFVAGTKATLYGRG